MNNAANAFADAACGASARPHEGQTPPVGNLWPYGLVQFGPLTALVVIAFRSEPGLWPVIGFYGLSKITEYFDKQIYSAFPLSGHTLKHLLAGIGAWYIVRWLQRTQSAPAASG